MNIFFLDRDLKKCAEYHVDKHIVKMITEQNQLLCSAYFFTGEDILSPYKLTHKNHPCAIWTRESLSNWLWLRDLTIELCHEYTYRYDKMHSGEMVVMNLVTPNLIDLGFTKFRCAMDEKYIISDDPVVNYRNYYNNAKRHLFNWKYRKIPEWIVGAERGFLEILEMKIK